MANRTSDELVDGLLRFIDASPTPYHAAAHAARTLTASGFSELAERDAWRLAPGERVYVVRGGSIAAFVIGQAPPQDSGFLLVGAHTDSPNLRVKPVPDVSSAGYRQLAVEPYGSPLWFTWLDRDLSLAGRIVIDDGTATGQSHLIDFARPLLRIPNLAIHLNRNVNSEGLKLNAQTQLVPVIGLSDVEGEASLGLCHMLAEQLSQQGQRCDAERILGWDLCLYDVQRASLSGYANEFIHAARLDNLASCYGALSALLQSTSSRRETRGFVLYDHEEVGSDSAQGAGSPFLGEVLARLTSGFAAGAAGAQSDALPRAIARSLLISADMAHAVHPNYADKHEPGHRPVLGQGPVLKTNVSQRYATDAETGAYFQRLCRTAGVTTQHYVVRSDLACGSTIGPITAARVGLRVVDIGNPLLSMHSIREQAATADVSAMHQVLHTFFG